MTRSLLSRVAGLPLLLIAALTPVLADAQVVFQGGRNIPALIAGGNDTLTDVGDPLILDGQATDLVFNVTNTGANLTKFALLVRPSKEASNYHIILETTGWDSVAGNLKEVVGTLKTLATTASGYAHVNIGPVYAVKWQASIASGARNAGTLTVTANPANNETVTIGTQVYRYRTALAAANDVLIDADAIAATGTLTLTDQPSDTQTCTIGDTTYTFLTVLVDTADNVLIGATASDTIDNLIAAVTAGAGEGTLYGTGTTANASATASAGAGDTMTVTALTGGTAGNSIATTETMSNASFGGATLSGGDSGSASDSLDNLIAAINAAEGGGTLYHASTAVHTQVTAAAGTGDTIDVTANSDIPNSTGTLIATTETLAAGSWGAATLADGVTTDVTISYQAR